MSQTNDAPSVLMVHRGVMIHQSSDLRARDMTRASSAPGGRWVVHANLLAKVGLLAMIMLVVIDPAWGNLEGKGSTARAFGYPLVALVVPVWWWARGRRHPYPWLADLMVTVPGFSDVLGNRLDLYDQVVWFDDWMHFMNTGLLCGAFLLLTYRGSQTPGHLLARSVSFGLTVSLLWEVGEYWAFITRSSELRTAYGDTLFDLCLGWLGAVTAAGMVILALRWSPSRYVSHTTAGETRS